MANSQSFPCQLLVAADPELIQARVKLLGMNLKISIYEDSQPRQKHQAGSIEILPSQLNVRNPPGVLLTENAHYVLDSISKTVKGCLERQFDAIVTGPVHKANINDAGTPFSGHTEYIAELTGGYPVMMLSAPLLRVALVTTHLPLCKVSENITKDRLEKTLLVLERDLVNRFSVQKPRILVCGLNPHAGEGGHLGMEEIEIISPVIEKLRNQNLNIVGPLPADTLFTKKYLDQADVILAMYHDQGLPVLKSLGFGQSVNITLGLPIIRTSVDHGTALDLAGTGEIDPSSLIAAIQYASKMASTDNSSSVQ